MSQTTALNVVILAAGQGKRMYSALPKVLHRLAGRPLLAHVLDAARALSPTKIIVVTGHGAEAVRNAVAAPDVVFVNQSPQLGTGHAIQQAQPDLVSGGKTLVLLGDVPLIRPETLKPLVEGAVNRVSMLTAVLDDPQGYGRVVRDARKKVKCIVEHKDASRAQLKIREINTGIFAYPTARLGAWLGKLKNNNAQQEYYITDVLPMAIKDRVPVEGVPCADAAQVQGINNRAQLAQLERIYQQRNAIRLLEQGVAIADPARIDVRGQLTCGQDVYIDVGCIFEGKVRLADGVRIGAHCVLRDVDVSQATQIEPFSHLVEAQIGVNCRIGPYSRIRPGTVLDEDVHIGNFVEVKASDIGFGTKASHLSYIGDSSLGRNVNVGAGTITCNYDGANKHRTVIEDDVFIGSDTQLVAPVTVRRGATIAAGTTVTKEVAADDLAISRVKQVAISGWKRPVKIKKAG
jgi:bifunctional UDP-N-acetylglucosamine pyrophosphorylase / glucosamine-1-phosphate N-acetyltransferase